MSLFNQCLEVFTLQIKMVNVWYVIDSCNPGQSSFFTNMVIIASNLEEGFSAAALAAFLCFNSFCSNYLESLISFVGKKWTSASRSESGKIVLVTTKIVHCRKPHRLTPDSMTFLFLLKCHEAMSDHLMTILFGIGMKINIIKF